MTFKIRMTPKNAEGYPLFNKKLGKFENTHKSWMMKTTAGGPIWKTDDPREADRKLAFMASINPELSLELVEM
jgi:hypothetical protein